MHRNESPTALEDARRLLFSHQYRPALAAYDQLAARFPRAAVVWFERGNSAAGAREFELADRYWNSALALEPANAELAALVGHQYQALRQPDRARACFRAAAAANPAGINARVSLAVLLERSNDLAGARRAVDECLAIDPRDEQARYLLAVLERREGRPESAEPILEELLSIEPRHPFVRHAARHELAAIHDRAGRCDDAMRRLDEAKAVVRGLTDTERLLRSYDRDAESGRRFTRALPRDVLAGWSRDFPESSRDPIPRLAFLGGHPRSGTTLLEQILDAHPGVAALDEPTAFHDVLQPGFFASRELPPRRLNRLRKDYISALLREVGPGPAGRMLVDKNPSPTSRLPVWLRVFPEIRVIVALRDPRDVVLSCYFQNLPLNVTNANFLTLERLARHYADLMDVWLAVRQWDPLPAIETRYEDLVADVSTEGRRVTAFLGMEWDEQQARFHEPRGNRQLYSPTYQDVTRPVYTRSIARWKAYERHLEPILPALKPYIEALGYKP